MLLRNNFYQLFFVILFIFVSCNNRSKEPIDTKKYKEPLIKVNKYLVEKDQDNIAAYVERHGWKMEVSETGLWYNVSKNGTEKATKNAIATINYKVKLLNNKHCYSSDSLGPKSFRIGQGGVESGLEEGILLMYKGDKARFIMPPHLAHGLLGDNNKILARATIIYEVELIELTY